MAGEVDPSTRVGDLEPRLADEVETRERLADISTRLASAFERDDILHRIAAAAADVVDAETGSILLVDEASHDLTVAVATGASEAEVSRIRIPAGRSIAGWTVRNRESVIVEDPRSDERFYEDVDAASDFETEALVAVPILAGDRAVGVLELVNKLGDRPFDQDDVARAEAFAKLAATALQGPPS